MGDFSLMKIYFAGSIRGGREDAELYHSLIEYMKQYGEVLTEHVGKRKLSVAGEKGNSESYIHHRDLEWLVASDVLVAEVTIPSLGVGYEIGRAVEQKKKILCLYRSHEGRKLSAMIAGCPDVIVKEYHTLSEAKRVIDDFLT